MEKNTINPETKKQEITNKEVIMTDNNKQENIKQEDKMTESANNTTSIEELMKRYNAIKENYAGLNENEKSSAVKSYNMGCNLNMLRKDDQYRNLLDNNGNPFKTWKSFCEEGCGFTRAYADKLMKSAAIQDELEQAGVTTVKQSITNLYSLHTAQKNTSLDIAEVWERASENNTEAFPTRNAVQKAINPESHTPKRTTKVANDLPSLLTAIKGLTLSDEDKQQVQQALNDLLNAGSTNPTQEEESPKDINVDHEKLSA